MIGGRLSGGRVMLSRIIDMTDAEAYGSMRL